MRILFIGDIVGKPGRRLVAGLLPALRRSREIDFVVANGENAAHGKGITASTARELFEAGVDALTGGNHSFRNRDSYELFEKDSRLLRPANYPPEAPAPGRGHALFRAPTNGVTLGIVNVQGRVFMSPLECPFRTARDCVEELRAQTRVILVDLHAEATSEKIAMRWHLDGQVSLLVGTHTHVPTADTEISARGTAYQTDAGMTGAHDGVLGIDREIILRQMTQHLPVRHQLCEGDPRLNGLLLEVDPESGRANRVERLCLTPGANAQDGTA